MEEYQKLVPLRRHMTVIEDALVDRVGRDLGASALGVYALLERRVGKDGRTTVSYDSLADACRLSKRQAMRVVAQLVDAGLVIVHGRDGNRGNVIELPGHIKGSDKGGDTGGDTGGVTPGSVSVTGGGDGSSRSSQGSRKRRALTTVPERMDVDQMLWGEEAVRLGLAPDRVSRTFDQFRDYWLAKGERRADWLASWRTWVRNEVKWTAERKGGGGESVAAVLQRRQAQRERGVG